MRKSVGRVLPALFVIDQSGSMEDPFAGTSTRRSKAQELADVINRLLQDGFAFNADLIETIRFIDIGTRVSSLR